MILGKLAAGDHRAHQRLSPVRRLYKVDHAEVSITQSPLKSTA